MKLNRIITIMCLRRLLPLMAFLAVMGGVSAQKQVNLVSPKVKGAFLRFAPAIPESEVEGTLAEIRGHHTFATVLDGDTIPLYYLKDVNVWGSYLLLTQKEINKNAKLIRNVKIMLPYAREAKRRLDVLEVEIAQMSPKERKAALKKAEKDIENEYKKDLKKRTYSQGLVLIKLIDRETSRSAYTLVKDLRGSFRAGLYQFCAKLFGYNLKDKFDPVNDSKDNLIDRIVKSVDRGLL